MTPTLYLPDAEKLCFAVLRDALPGVTFVHDLSGDFAKLDKFVRLFKTPGSSAIDPRYVDRATMDIVAFAQDSPGMADGRDAASTLARQCGAALLAARISQQVYDAGDMFASIASYTEQSSPWPSDIDLHNFYAFQATYTLVTRPQGRKE